jgi:F0F1-type ATP synthase membrane subunit b/b'
MRKITTAQIIFYVLSIIYIGMAIWANCYAFYELAISNISLISKFLVFVLIVLFDMYLAWDFTDRHYKVKIAEIKDTILKAKFELATADAEIRYRDMFSSADSLIKLVHEHIKIAKEHLDHV